MDIQKELEKQGLDPKKAKVYLAVLELGRATIIELSRKTKLKRTTVYDIVLILIGMGYVTEARKGKRRLFIAEDPEVLLNTNEQKLLEFKNLIPFLTEIRSKVVPKPTIKFYDGTLGVRTIMEELLNVKNKEQLFWSSISDLVDFFGNRYMESWVKRRIKRGILSKVLLTKKRNVADIYMQSNDKFLREIRWLPKTYLFKGVVCIFDNKVCYISSREESFGFVIESNEFSQVMRLIFESSWAVAPLQK
ncbi:MAG: helix-turn-helix domain-containing protein [Parcubacteria group bacterium]|jgi:sugar-specific transcriptional regulator TrmB